MTDFQNVEALSLALRSEKASRERFRLPLSHGQACNALWAAMKAVVEHRGRTFRLDTHTRSHIEQAAAWLTDPAATPGLMLCGLCGNGKTSLATAISWLIGYVTERELGYSRRMCMPLVTAKEIASMCMAAHRNADRHERYAALAAEPMIIIDELGEEPREVIVYGMTHTPMADLMAQRYAAQRMTVVTTNLETDQIRAKYGERIYDRFREMLTPVIFENDSYRGA